MNNYLFLIVGMTLVTYLPRLIPLLALSDKKTNRKFEKFLSYIPYTSLSILIIRGLITAEKYMILATLAGILIAGFLSYKKDNLVLSVLAGIALSFIVKTII